MLNFIACKLYVYVECDFRKGDEVEPMHGSRIHVREARQYYMDFVAAKDLIKYFKPYTTVTSVERIKQTRHHIDNESGEEIAVPNENEAAPFLWEIRGFQLCPSSKRRKEFCYRAQNVVVATGSYDAPNRLGVAGEESQYVLHSLSELENAIQSGRLNSTSDPIVVVGAGLSAADAILLARKHGISVVHAFHRAANDPHVYISKLPEQLYPEYREVHEMMKGKIDVEWYRSCAKSSIVKFHPDGNVILRKEGQLEKDVIHASYAVVLIGTRPQLSFLPNSGKALGMVPYAHIHPKHNPINVDPFTYQSNYERGLYAMGPLVGESFVRFLQGGSLGIASHLWKTKLGKL